MILYEMLHFLNALQSLFSFKIIIYLLHQILIIFFSKFSQQNSPSSYEFHQVVFMELSQKSAHTLVQICSRKTFSKSAMSMLKYSVQYACSKSSWTLHKTSLYKSAYSLQYKCDLSFIILCSWSSVILLLFTYFSALRLIIFLLPNLHTFSF